MGLTLARVRLSGRPAVMVLLLGVFFSVLGDSLATIAFALYAASIGSTGFLSAVLIANALPMILLGLWGGVVADRLLRWWWWPVALLGQAAAFAVMAATATPAVIVALMFASSSLTALMGPISRKLLHHHAGTHSGRVGRNLATVTGIAGAIGVAVGSVSFGAGALATLLSANAASFLLLAALSLLVASPDAFRLDRGPARGTLLGFRRLSAPGVSGGTGVILITALVLSTSLEDVAGVFVLLNHAGLTAWQYGMALVLWSGFLVLGTRLIPRTLTGPRSGLVGGPLVIGLVFVATAVFLPPWWTIWVLFMAGGLANGGFNAGLNTTILSGIDGHEQGRAWAAFQWIVSSCLLVGYLISGLLGNEYARYVVGLSGALTLITGVVAACTRHRRRSRSW